MNPLKDLMNPNPMNLLQGMMNGNPQQMLMNMLQQRNPQGYQQLQQIRCFFYGIMKKERRYKNELDSTI